MDENSPEVRREYELLNILDAKASALLTFNAVGLTALAVWLGYIPLNLLHLTLDVVFLALLVSCAFLLAIIALRWASKSTDADVLRRLRRRRSGHYRVAWAIAIGSVFCVTGVSAIHLIGTALIALGVCGDACQAFYSSDVFGNLDYDG